MISSLPNYVISEELKQVLIERSNSLANYNILEIQAYKNNKSNIKTLTDIINSIFLKYGVSERITHKQIKFFAQYIGNIELKDKKFSEILIDFIYPKPNIEHFAHFTDIVSAINILKSEKLRLYSLQKYTVYEEFEQFYKIHGYDGYEISKTDIFGHSTGYIDLMKDNYIFSLTSQNNNNENMWKIFGDEEDGVKINFRIKSVHYDFRKIHYSDKKIPILDEFDTQIFTNYCLPLNYSYVSKIGSFYIGSNFKYEEEYRFMIKNGTDQYKFQDFQIKNENEHNFIELPFQSKYADIQIESLEIGKNAEISNINNLKDICQKKNIQIT